MPEQPSRPPLHEGFVIRPLVTVEECRQAERIQAEVWGTDDLEVVPSSLLRAAHHAGGMVVGAFRGDAMVAFAYGFVALPHGRGMRGVGLHSHMLAVVPAARGLGVGQALKWFQRDWCLARELAWVTWTFDPLQARNARLNLEHLGAVAVEYLPDFYGPMTGPLGGDQPSDRLLALWDLASDRVAKRAARWEARRGTSNGGAGPPPCGAELPTAAAGAEPAASAEPSAETSAETSAEPSAEPAAEPDAEPASDAADRAEEAWLVRASGAGIEAEPIVADAGDAARLRVAVPSDVTTLLRAAPERAARWRRAVASAMQARVETGYLVTGFQRGAYVLERRSDV